MRFAAEIKPLARTKNFVCLAAVRPFPQPGAVGTHSTRVAGLDGLFRGNRKSDRCAHIGFYLVSAPRVVPGVELEQSRFKRIVCRNRSAYAEGTIGLNTDRGNCPICPQTVNRKFASLISESCPTIIGPLFDN